MMDATIVRAHACATGYEKDSQKAQALGRCVGGFTSKINERADALGNPLKFILSASQQHDIKTAPSLVEGIEGADILADKAYDNDKFINTIETQGCRAVIFPRKNRAKSRYYDKDIYKERRLWTSIRLCRENIRFEGADPEVPLKLVFPLDPVISLVFYNLHTES